METHRNNIGLMRLVLASMVIVGHSPEMTDGDRHREPLTAILGSLSLGEVAVGGFFLLSGFLIARSMAQSRSTLYYLERRVLRIYPAFIVAYMLCVFALGPIVGARPWNSLPLTFSRLLFLLDPMYYSGQLANLHYPALNGSMWTIAYEFRCYLLVALLGTLGILQRKRAILTLAVLCSVLSVGTTFPFIREAVDALVTSHHGAVWFVGIPSESLRLTATFLVGVCFYVYREAILPFLGSKLALFGAFMAAALMYRDTHLANLAVAVFGAFPLFWLSIKARLGPLQRINDNWDISYGTYLYGWPIAIFILWLQPSMSPWILAAITLPLALAFGVLSWWGVEKGTKDIRRSKAVAGKPPATREAPQQA